MKIFGLRLNQITFILAAVGILASLPWFSAGGVWIWIFSYIFAVIGVVLVFLNI